MKSKFYLSVFFGLMLGFNLQASKVSLQTAETVALNFYKLNTTIAKGNSAPTAFLKYTRSEADNTTDFYVFGIAPKGFVIVAADDNLEPVIGYSTESDFRTDFDKTGVKDWMDNASKKISYALVQQATADARISGLWTSYIQGTKPGNEKNTVVNPLLTTTWNQEPFYNALCPNNTTDNLQCVTGCVATAMAQIMKFWNFPPTGTGSYSYNDATPIYSHNYGTQAADFSATTYSWPTMANSINSSNPAIATLMYQCGVAVAMDYGDDKQGGSGAAVLQSEAGYGRPCAELAYKTYFFYNASTLKGVTESSYSSDQWTSLLQGELAAGRPVQYEGQDPGIGGHTWVLDGCDANGMFHMNWGWGGYENGYYSLGNLAVASVNFSSSEAALIGLQPGIYVTPCNTPVGLSASVAATSAVLNWTPVSGATGYNLQYKIALDTGWATISNINSSSYTLTGLSSCSAYQFKVQTVCSGGTSSYSTAVPFSTMGCILTYCNSGANNVSHGFIQNVKLGSINNPSTYGKGYKSFTNLSTDLILGSSDVITLTPGFTDSTYAEYWTVYIDYNQNGSFAEVGEVVANANGTGAVSATINVPLSAVLGPTTMRIQMQQGAYQNNSCATFTYGEVQDFAVNIVSNTTGENNIGLATFKLHPNPAADHIILEYNGINEGMVRTNIYNMAGQKVMSEESNSVAGVNVHQINVDRFNNGIYILEIESNGELSRQKFIITR